MRARALAALVGVTALLAAGCGGGTTGGDPRTATSEQQPSSTGKALPNYGAPAVPAPLDISGIISTPCQALTKQQVKSFAGTLAETHTTQTTLTGKGKSCGWTFHGERYSLGTLGGGVALSGEYEQYQGLSSIYRAKQRGAYKIFREVGPIAGYPAVVYGSTPEIGYGDCNMSVGLQNDVAYRITVGLSSNHPKVKTPCRVAKKLARYVVQNLKSGR